MKEIIKSFTNNCIEYLKTKLDSPKREIFLGTSRIGKSDITPFMQSKLDESSVAVFLTPPSYKNKYIKIQIYFKLEGCDESFLDENHFDPKYF